MNIDVKVKTAECKLSVWHSRCFFLLHLERAYSHNPWSVCLAFSICSSNNSISRDSLYNSSAIFTSSGFGRHRMNLLPANTCSQSFSSAHLGTSGYQVPFSEQVILWEPNMANPESHWMVTFSDSMYWSLLADSNPFFISGFWHRALHCGGAGVHCECLQEMLAFPTSLYPLSHSYVASVGKNLVVFV